MSFKEYYTKLNEMPAWDDSNKYFQNVYKPGGRWAAELKKIAKNNPIEIIKLGNYDIKLFEIGTQIHAVAYLGQEPVGDLHCSKIPTVKNVPFVNSVGVSPDHQKQGIARGLYDVVINKYNCLMSGGALTGENDKGSFHMWQGMKDVNKYIARRDPNGKWSFVKVNDFSKDDMTDEYTRFFVCKDDIKKILKVYDNGEYLELMEGILKEMPMWNDSAKILSVNFKDPKKNENIQSEYHIS